MANTLVLNDPVLPLIEVTSFDLALTAEKDLLIAVTGAECDLAIDGFSAPQWQPIPIMSGSTVTVSRLRNGLRCYVAINGAIDAPAVLGSVSPDPSLEFGWYLRSGDIIRNCSAFRYFDHPYLRHPVFQPQVPPRTYSDPAVIKVTAGPDFELFDTPLETLQNNEYEVGNQSNEVGLQLLGVAPGRMNSAEMLTRGVCVGAIEVTPSGSLIALLPGRLLTAGYPVVAVATTPSRSVLGQLQPGDRLRFQVVSGDEAVRAARAERRSIDQVDARMRRIIESLHLGI